MGRSKMAVYTAGVLLCAFAAAAGMLSGCSRPATRRELIQWFQETCTRAPVVVSFSPDVVEHDKIYEAYLKDHPDLKFYIKSDYSYVGEHAQFQNRTNFYAVYGGYYFSQYRKEHPVHFAEASPDKDAVTFSLNVRYGDRAELAQAFDELCEIQAYMEAQEYPVKGWHHIYFESPLCAPERQAFTLGSGVADLTGTGDLEAALRGKQKDLETELAVWTAFFRLHPDWFTREELEQAFAYRESWEYGGSWSVYIGGLSIYDGAECVAHYPQVAAPDRFAISFRQLYQILSDVGWETLEGDEEDFSFSGVDGVLYRFSYALQRVEHQERLACTWLADGVPYTGFGAGDGYLTSDYTFQKITGLQMKTEG